MRILPSVRHVVCVMSRSYPARSLFGFGASFPPRGQPVKLFSHSMPFDSGTRQHEPMLLTSDLPSDQTLPFH